MKTHPARPPGMPPGLPPAVLTALAMALSVAPVGRADGPPPGTAILQESGQARTGRVLGDDAAGFRFEPADDSVPIDLATLEDIAFGPPVADPAASPPPFRVELAPHGRISGQLVEVTPEVIHLQLDPGEPPLTIRRTGARAVVQRPGEAQVFADDFEAPILDAQRWSTVGAPAPVEEPVHQGRRSLRLPPGGSAATVRLAEAVVAGRLELAYHDDGLRIGGQVRFVDLAFRGADGVHAIQILLGWEEEILGVRTRGAEPTLAVQPLLRRPGWHRLTVRFGPDRTDVAVDGLELAHGGGPGGPLVEVRLASDATRAGLDAHFDALRLIRSAEPVGPVEVEPEQDEVRLITGDQLFGTLLTADAERVVLDLDGRTVMLSWSEVSGLHLRRRTEPSEPLEGLWVHLRWQPEGEDDDREADHVEGVLRAIDAESAVVEVPYVGAVRIPTARLVRMTVLGPRRVIIVDPNRRHLGNRLVADLDPPQPEGSTLELTFLLQAPPDGVAALALDVVQVVGIEGDLNYSGLVRAGELRTFVALNGHRLGDLNSQVTTRNDEPLRIRLPIPAGLLRDGVNTIRFEQVGTKDDPDEVDNLGLLGIALESPIFEPPPRDQP